MKAVTMKNLGVLFLATFFSLTVSAEEHSLSTIQGTQIDLKSYDHAIAGSIKNFVVWGAVDEETFSSELLMKKDGQIIRATFKKEEDGKIGGTIRHEADSKTYLTELAFVRLDKQENTLVFNVNNEEIALKITADSFAQGHFKNPTYSANIRGQEVRYTLQGSACYSYSLHLAFLILGAYLH